MSTFIAFIAALGVGSVLAAIVGWFSAKAVTISNHRQNWINALRDDIATYLKEIEALHYRRATPTGDPESIYKHQEIRASALLVYRRILMRLNMTEPPHLDLAEALKNLLSVDGGSVDNKEVDRVVDLTRTVLKHEWAVTKYGIFTEWVLARKNNCRIKRASSTVSPVQGT